MKREKKKKLEDYTDEEIRKIESLFKDPTNKGEIYPSDKALKVLKKRIKKKEPINKEFTPGELKIIKKGTKDIVKGKGINWKDVD